MFSTARRVKLGGSCLARTVPDPLRTGLMTWQVFLRHTRAAPEPFPTIPSPRWAYLTPQFSGFVRGQVKSISLRIIITEFVVLVPFPQVKSLSYNRSTGWYQLIEGGGVLSQNFPLGLQTAHFQKGEQWHSSTVLFSTPPTYIRHGNQLATSRNISWPRFRHFMNFEPLSGCRDKMLCWK